MKISMWSSFLYGRTFESIIPAMSNAGFDSMDLSTEHLAELTGTADGKKRYLKIYKTSGVSFVERQMVGYEDEIVQHCVGSIPEVFDGNPPFKGRGAVAFAMNVAQILRTSQLLKQYESKLEG